MHLDSLWLKLLFQGIAAPIITVVYAHTHAHSYICTWCHFGAVITLKVVMLITHLQKFHTTSLFNFLLLCPECQCEDTTHSICQLVSQQKSCTSVCQKMNKFSRVSILFFHRGRSWLKSLTAAPSAAVLNMRVVRESTFRTLKTNFVYFSICVTHRYHVCVRACVEKGEVCLFQGVTVLGPGQSLVQYFEGELCYTVQCLHDKDPHTGFHAMEITSVNCSQKCGPVRICHIHMKLAFPYHLILLHRPFLFGFALCFQHQVYAPSTDPQVCCGSCKNISCNFTNENGSAELFTVRISWSTSTYVACSPI